VWERSAPEQPVRELPPRRSQPRPPGARPAGPAGESVRDAAHSADPERRRGRARQRQGRSPAPGRESGEWAPVQRELRPGKPAPDLPLRSLQVRPRALPRLGRARRPGWPQCRWQLARPRRSRTGQLGVPLVLLSLQGLCPCVGCASGRTSETPTHGAYPGLPESRGQELRLFHVKQQPNNSKSHFLRPFHVEHLLVTGPVPGCLSPPSCSGNRQGFAPRRPAAAGGLSASPIRCSTGMPPRRRSAGEDHEWRPAGVDRKTWGCSCPSISPVARNPMLLQAQAGMKQWSEQRLLGRDPVSAGEAVGAELPLAQNAVLETLMDHFGRLQAELVQRLRRPARGPAVFVVRRRGL
jgi:hypothetical protein